jgi:quinol monooxygenase YgiN
MSVIIIGRMTVDRANVEKMWNERKADMEAVAAEAKAAGAIHHRWAFAQKGVVIIDEWPDAESFQKFFESQQMIPQLMHEAKVEGAPDFEILEARSGPDEF